MDICVSSMDIEDIREEFADAETVVYWDVEDFPVTDFVSFSRNIRLALADAGYRGKVSITAYGENEPEDEYCKNAGITFVSRGSSRARMHRMLVDIFFWAGKNRPREPKNLMLITKSMRPREYISFENAFEYHISVLHAECYNILLAVPDDYKLHDWPSKRNYTVWLWSSLCACESPLDLRRPPRPTSPTPTGRR